MDYENNLRQGTVNMLIRCQFHQRSTCSFYAHGSQKRKMILTTKLKYYAFGICTGKSCTYNVDEPRCQFCQHFQADSLYESVFHSFSTLKFVFVFFWHKESAKMMLLRFNDIVLKTFDFDG